MTTPWNRAAPQIPQIPAKLTQGDSAAWSDGPFTDSLGNALTSTDFAFGYVLAGPIQAPVELAGVANGLGWTTSIDTAASAGLAAGLYSWSAAVTATNVQITVGRGQLTVLADLSALTSSYDSRTRMQKALDDCEAAIAAYAASGKFMKRYMIGQRSMDFADPMELQKYADWLRGRVQMERAQADGGKSRMLLTRFDRAT